MGYRRSSGQCNPLMLTPHNMCGLTSPGLIIKHCVRQPSNVGNLSVTASVFSLQMVILVKLVGLDKLAISLGVTTLIYGLSAFIGPPVAGSVFNSRCHKAILRYKHDDDDYVCIY